MAVTLCVRIDGPSENQRLHSRGQFYSFRPIHLAYHILCGVVLPEREPAEVVAIRLGKSSAWVRTPP